MQENNEGNTENPMIVVVDGSATKEEQEVLNRGSKKSEQLRKKLMDVDVNSSKWLTNDCILQIFLF